VKKVSIFENAVVDYPAQPDAVDQIAVVVDPSPALCWVVLNSHAAHDDDHWK
jgi:hypothetical protein